MVQSSRRKGRGEVKARVRASVLPEKRVEVNQAQKCWEFKQNIYFLRNGEERCVWRRDGRWEKARK